MKIDNPYSGILWCLLIGVFCVNTAHFISIPFLSLYLANKTHCSLWISGFAVGVAPFFSIVGGFVGGQLSDRYGRLFLLYLSVFATAGIFILFYGAFNLESNSVQWAIIIFLNALFGLFTSFFQPSVMALLSDLVEKTYREQVFHLRYAAINIGAIIGPMLGIFLGITLSPIAFLIGGLIYLIYGSLLYLALKIQNINCLCQVNESVSILDTTYVVFTDKKLFNFILFHVVFAVCYSQITSTLAYYIAQNLNHGTQVYSFIITLNALFVLLGQAPVYLLCKHIAKIKSIFYGCFVFCMGCIGLAYSGQEVIYFYSSILLITLGELLIFPFASGFIDEIAPPHLKGTYFGALTFRELGLALGPILGGLILQIFGGQILFIFIGILALCSFYFMVQCERSKYALVNPIIPVDEGV